MSNLPRLILRDCMLWADRESKLGQIGDITPPVPQKKLEELRNAGMVKPREVMLGYEKLEFSFKMPSLDPQILTLFGLKPGVENPFMITGALVDEDGTVHSAVMNIRGFLKQADAGSWKTGDLSESDYQVSVHYYKLEVDGVNLIEMDDFDVKINGVSQYKDIRNALLL
ncbi:phage major tail tube protein [Bacillus subtilis]|uniref:phage major tail tube protein n=1 Tax=Pseudochrobactrum asaccharolyticum TaxID=354351 RepID=UPI001F1C7EAE|nr:phage major tail tube protein [Pseudochrobactrum asaccharolyticum]MCF7646902.1 phage major tail tube protein [Pseudochrobactrum asaccharolyticum]MCF7673544.1 phage major tail tube protein [Bacillus subtilis]